MYVHTYIRTHARTHVQLSYLGALVMNHHQVVDDVQSKLPRGVQFQDMGLLTGSLPEQTWKSVTHTHLCLIKICHLCCSDGQKKNHFDH